MEAEAFIYDSKNLDDYTESMVKCAHMRKVIIAMYVELDSRRSTAMETPDEVMEITWEILSLRQAMKDDGPMTTEQVDKFVSTIKRLEIAMKKLMWVPRI